MCCKQVLHCVLYIGVQRNLAKLLYIMTIVHNYCDKEVCEYYSFQCSYIVFVLWLCSQCSSRALWWHCSHWPVALCCVFMRERCLARKSKIVAVRLLSCMQSWPVYICVYTVQLFSMSDVCTAFLPIASWLLSHLFSSISGACSSSWCAVTAVCGKPRLVVGNLWWKGFGIGRYISFPSPSILPLQCVSL